MSPVERARRSGWQGSSLVCIAGARPQDQEVACVLRNGHRVRLARDKAVRFRVMCTGAADSGCAVDSWSHFDVLPAPDFRLVTFADESRRSSPGPALATYI